MRITIAAFAVIIAANLGLAVADSAKDTQDKQLAKMYHLNIGGDNLYVNYSYEGNINETL